MRDAGGRVPPFGQEGRLDHGAVGAVQARRRWPGGRTARQHAVRGSTRICCRARGLRRQQAQADLGPDAAGRAHLEVAQAGARRQRGQRRMVEANASARSSWPSWRRSCRPWRIGVEGHRTAMPPLKMNVARPSQKLRKLKIELMTVGEFLGSTCRVCRPSLLNTVSPASAKLSAETAPGGGGHEGALEHALRGSTRRCACGRLRE